MGKIQDPAMGGAVEKAGALVGGQGTQVTYG